MAGPRTHVVINTDELGDISTALNTIRTRFEGEHSDPARYLDDLGPSRLVDEARNYVDDSREVFDRMANDMGKLKEAIDPVIESFHKVDEDLGNELKGDEGSGPPPNVQV
ncbi:hypothetical protein [Nocardiopsis halotolerans]|uniref:hypothetical protein n=1 Tax=Nocardiopsis halotolerans TaxID=124252 RepID=UPI00034804D0|nr:hypothetical protein [Nocardiopsis halotolerans]